MVRSPTVPPRAWLPHASLVVPGCERRGRRMCDRPRRHGGIPAHAGIAAAIPRGGGDPRCRETILGRVATTRRGALLAQDRAAARRSLLGKVSLSLLSLSPRSSCLFVAYGLLSMAFHAATSFMFETCSCGTKNQPPHQHVAHSTPQPQALIMPPALPAPYLRAGRLRATPCAHASRASATPLSPYAPSCSRPRPRSSSAEPLLACLARSRATF